MLVLTVLLLAGMLFGVAAVSVGHGSPLSEAPVDRREPILPADPVSAADVETLRFTMVLRGYRMDEVDAVLDRLSTELSVRDAEINRLRSRVSLGAQVLAGEAPAADSRLGLSEPPHDAETLAPSSEPYAGGFAPVSPEASPYGAGPHGANPYGANPYRANPSGDSPYGDSPYDGSPPDQGAYEAPAPYETRPAPGAESDEA